MDGLGRGAAGGVCPGLISLEYLDMYWLGMGSLFSAPHPHPLLCRLWCDGDCKLDNINSDELDKKRDMRCGMDPAGGNRREARGDLRSSFLKARFSQPADSVNTFTPSLKY